MKKHAFLLLASAFLLGACSSATRRSLKSPLYDVEVVEAEGMAPLEENAASARKSALANAMQNALGLVVGVYVSQESMVSRSVLIDDTIKAGTEGYIEKYEVLKEWEEGGFFKVKIKAHVRREDLAAKMSRIENEPQKLGNPVISFDLAEKINGEDRETRYCSLEMKSELAKAGFKISDSGEGDILIKGNCSSSFNTKEGLGGFISYRGSVSVKAVKKGSDEVIATEQFSAGGIDLSEDSAAQSALINASRKSAENLKEKILRSLRESTVINLRAGGLGNMNSVIEFINALRNIPVVRDCWLRKFGGGNAEIDVAMKKADASELAKKIVKIKHFSLNVEKTDSYGLSVTARPLD